MIDLITDYLNSLIPTIEHKHPLNKGEKHKEKPSIMFPTLSHGGILIELNQLYKSININFKHQLI